MGTTPKKTFVRSLRARLLADRMRQFREQLGLLLEDVAPYVGRDISTLARRERGEMPFRREDVLALLNLYGVHDGRVRAELLHLAENSARLNWMWLSSAPSPSTPDVVVPQLVPHDETPPPPIPWLYSQATSLCLYGSAAVPELLQTAPYAAALATHTANPRTPAEQRVSELRIAALVQRQELVVDDPRHPITAVVNEHVLRRPIGGHDVLASQLERLHRLAIGGQDDHTDIRIQVLPADVEVWDGNSGAFTILHFPAMRPVVLTEQLGAQSLLEGPYAARYVAAFERLLNAALSPAASLTKLGADATAARRPRGQIRADRDR